MMHSDNWLLLGRTVRFGDTDAAGVLHFHQLLRWCHEAYEESLERFGLRAATIFPSPGHAPAVALPIVHCQADYLAPLVVGDPLAIQLEPRRLGPDCFELHYGFQRSTPEGAKPVARGLTRHLAIDASSSRRCPLPDPISRWLEASSLGDGVQASTATAANGFAAICHGTLAPAPGRPASGEGAPPAARPA